MDWKQVGRESWQWHEKEKAGMRFPVELVAGQASQVTGDDVAPHGEADATELAQSNEDKGSDASDAGGASG